MTNSFYSLWNHCRSFDRSGPFNTLNIPTTVTSVGFEIWGGGGGGGSQASGQAGGYVQGIFLLGGGQTVSVQIGSGGSGGTNQGNPPVYPTSYGGDTIIKVTSGQNTIAATVIARGGAANGVNDSGGYVLQNDPSTSTDAQWGLTGQFGKGMEDIKIAYDNNIYTTTYKCGNGGDGKDNPHTGGYGALYMIKTDTSTSPYFNVTVLQSYPAVPANAPGGGGGAGLLYLSGQSPQYVAGSNGANGKAILYFNM